MDSIALLKELISINSVFPEENEIAAYLEMLLIENGFDVARHEIAPGRFNVVAQRGTVGLPTLFYAHMDTVPAYGQWESSPREPRESGDKLYGLGAYDIKSGIAAIIKACEIETDRHIKIAFGVDEENISEGAHSLTKTKFLDNIEGVVVCEVETGDNENQGPRSITLGRRGRCVYEFHVPGRSAHGACDGAGINAINNAAILSLALEQMNGTLSKHEVLPPASQFIRKIYAESTSLSFPESAVLELDRHLVTPETPDGVLKELNAYLDSLYASNDLTETDGKRIAVSIKQRRTPYLAPYIISKDHPLVHKMSSAIKHTLNAAPRYTGAASVADENVFAMKGLPVVSIGCVGGNEHSANEWVSKSSYLELIEVLKTFIRTC